MAFALQGALPGIQADAQLWPLLLGAAVLALGLWVLIRRPG
ncbi:MAG: hypothetical protein KatS3mg102_1659 [Planctomycetota bacterium]|nr:MAG: hypothetical protein KatS3mg102_1659 [Planctomycetota bacterium]